MTPHDARTRWAVGCMTGTSLDGLDVALIRATGRALDLRATHAAGHSVPLGPLAAPLRALAEQQPMTAGDIAALARDFSLLHARAVHELLAATPPDARPELLCVHGQTVFHRPPVSWQLLNAAVIAEATGLPVVHDLRAADLAAGGQGAPITPIADFVFFAENEPRAVLNLGGFANATLLPPRSAGVDAIRGGDVCAVNHILDAVARRTLGVPFDQDGRHAAAGHVHDDALDDLLGVLAAQRAAGRSLGTGDEVASWIGRQWRGGAGVPGPDLAATACEAIAQTIARFFLDHAGAHPPARILLAGGGARNAALARAIASCCSARVQSTADHGLPVEFREAAAFAVLGLLCADGVPITLPAVTGGRAGVLSGSWTGLNLPGGPA